MYVCRKKKKGKKSIRVTIEEKKVKNLIDVVSEEERGSEYKEKLWHEIW